MASHKESLLKIAQFLYKHIYVNFFNYFFGEIQNLTELLIYCALTKLFKYLKRFKLHCFLRKKIDFHLQPKSCLKAKILLRLYVRHLLEILIQSQTFNLRNQI